MPKTPGRPHLGREDAGRLLEGGGNLEARRREQRKKTL